jgi:hypothetical protein
VDADVQKDDCFSIPRHSLILDPSSDNRDYLPYNLGWFPNIVRSLTSIFISCPKPILSPPNYIVDASSCKNGSTLLNSTSNISSPSSHNMEGNYSYVFIGYYDSYYSIGYHSLGDIPDLCHVNLMYPASFTFLDQLKNETNIISYTNTRHKLFFILDFYATTSIFIKC